jgi:hypothetical protein
VVTIFRPGEVEQRTTGSSFGPEPDFGLVETEERRLSHKSKDVLYAPTNEQRVGNFSSNLPISLGIGTRPSASSPTLRLLTIILRQARESNNT